MDAGIINNRIFDQIDFRSTVEKINTDERIESLSNLNDDLDILEYINDDDEIISNVLDETNKILTTFWLTAALANLNPVFKNSNILQCGAYDSYNFHLTCQSWISSIVFTWINMILFIISLIVSCRVKQEKKKGLHSFNKPAISSKQKKLTSNRQSVLLKQTLDNPNKPQPVMLETGFKPLMLPIMVDNESQSNEIGSGGYSDRSSKRNSMFDNGGLKRYSLLNIAKKRLSG
nr:13577_t:CDS:2 [Entrophospora candida]